ncbi:MAG TPA: hypothetical protein VGJ32_04425 [Solirubrobacteraceae bacterium]|jgi:hypothetical protein
MSEEPRVKLAAHPRARRHISTAKGWGGLIGFVVVGLLSRRAHMSGPDAALHALAGGIGLYLLAWAGAVAVWRELAVAEVVRARKLLQEQAREAAEAAAKAKAAAKRAA